MDGGFCYTADSGIRDSCPPEAASCSKRGPVGTLSFNSEQIKTPQEWENPGEEKVRSPLPL